MEKKAPSTILPQTSSNNIQYSATFLNYHPLLHYSSPVVTVPKGPSSEGTTGESICPGEAAISKVDAWQVER